MNCINSYGIPCLMNPCDITYCWPITGQQCQQYQQCQQGQQGPPGPPGQPGPAGTLSCWTEICGTDANGVSYALWQPKTGTAAILHPLAAGYLSAQVADNTVANGGQRGLFSTDWQRERTSSTQVASGPYSFIAGGRNNVAAGDSSFASGIGTTNNGDASFTFGNATGGTIETRSTSIGSGSFGRALNNGTINTGTGADGSLAFGYADTGTSIIRSGDNADGSMAHGYAQSSGLIETGTNAQGSLAFGYAFNTGRISTGVSSAGSLAFGNANDNGSIIETGPNSSGSMAAGLTFNTGIIRTGSGANGSVARGQTQNTAIIETGANAIGSLASGFAFANGIIRANARGSIAQGIAISAGTTETVETNGDASMALGRDVIVPLGNNYSLIMGQYGTALSNIATGIVDPNLAIIQGTGSLQIAGGSGTGARDISVAIGTTLFGNPSFGGGVANFWSSSGADYAEYFEWSELVQSNDLNRDLIGYFVSLDVDNNEKIKIAPNSESVIGISTSKSAYAGFVCDGAELGWKDAHLRDDFGRIIYQLSYEQSFMDIFHKYNIDISQDLIKLVKDNSITSYVTYPANDYKLKLEHQRFIQNLDRFNYKIVNSANLSSYIEGLNRNDRSNMFIELKQASCVPVSVANPKYDPSKTYIPRSQRPEWTPVSLMGKVLVRDNGNCKPGEKCDCVDGIAVPGSHWYVLSRTSNNVIKILYR